MGLRAFSLGFEAGSSGPSASLLGGGGQGGARGAGGVEGNEGRGGGLGMHWNPLKLLLHLLWRKTLEPLIGAP